MSAIVAFVLAFAGSLVLHTDSTLHDTDAYYHLAIGRAYAEEGTIDDLPWARMSLVSDDGFGDKEWLFHVSLAPFVAATAPGPPGDRGAGPLKAGRWALAFWNALLAAALAALASRQLGLWAVALPFWLFYASTELAWRLVRLRPELLSLGLLLVALWALARGRHRWLGLSAFAYTLGYTAFQALWGLVVLCVAYFGWTRRKIEWAPLLYASLGVGLALILHPHFPKNLEVWVVQNVSFFLEKGRLDVGTEIRPNYTDVLVMVHLGWIVGLGALWWAGRAASSTRRTASEGDRRWADVLAIATLAFGFLYLLMSRFSLYFYPLMTLWVLAEIRRRGGRIGAWIHLGGRRIPLVALLALSLALSFPEAARQLGNYRHRTHPGPDDARLKDRVQLAAALPEGARVAADWGPTATYMLWAPQARYLNVLDPVFLAMRYPEAHRALRGVLEGREADIPVTTLTTLESEYLAYPTVRGFNGLKDRLAHDPRAELLHRGSHTLVHFRPPKVAEGTAHFVLDWHFASQGIWPLYPRAVDSKVRAIEGYVDAERLFPEARCVLFARDIEGPLAIEIELAPYGPTTLRLDDHLIAEVTTDLKAFLGRGLRLPLVVAAGRHRLTVSTCEDETKAYKGFYFVAGL
jgi:hypothetical protein